MLNIYECSQWNVRKHTLNPTPLEERKETENDRTKNNEEEEETEDYEILIILFVVIFSIIIYSICMLNVYVCMCSLEWT